MKKKILSVALSAVFVLSMSACAEKAPESVADVSTEVSTEEVTSVSSTENDGTYVIMNIPYGDFFAAEFEGGENVDAVTSATMNKAANENLTGGTYHLEDNSKILGVSFPVLIKEGVSLDDSLKVADEAALYAAADFSYTELSDAPTYYKELSVDESGKFVFGETHGEAEELSGDTASVNTATHWGDYEIDLDQSLSELTVIAAKVHTTDGASYGFRSLENLWRGFEIAFATTDSYVEPHGNTVIYEPYADLPGKTVDEVVLYTKNGVKKISVNLYLPLKFENTLEVADAKVSDKAATLTVEGYPEGYDFAYEVSGDSADISCDGSNVSWENAIAGTYTLNVTDNSGVYAPYSTSFVLSTDKAVAVAKEDGIEKAKDASDEEFTAYIKNITAYVVNGEEVSGSGKRGARIITDDGSADKTLNKVFKEVGEYEVVIKSAGFPDVTIKVNVTEVAPEEEKKEGKH
ncbi:MAG: DUF1533 domain-containing protein [Lachnospiraceae bacterium]|nr:DUF1533 domain-containing protein [Lachnospiraceae bacterium]